MATIRCIPPSAGLCITTIPSGTSIFFTICIFTNQSYMFNGCKRFSSSPSSSYSETAPFPQTVGTHKEEQQHTTPNILDLTYRVRLVHVKRTCPFNGSPLNFFTWHGAIASLYWSGLTTRANDIKRRMEGHICISRTPLDIESRA